MPVNPTKTEIANFTGVHRNVLIRKLLDKRNYIAQLEKEGVAQTKTLTAASATITAKSERIRTQAELLEEQRTTLVALRGDVDRMEAIINEQEIKINSFEYDMEQARRKLHIEQITSSTLMGVIVKLHEH